MLLTIAQPQRAEGEPVIDPDGLETGLDHPFFTDPARVSQRRRMLASFGIMRDRG